MKLEIVAREEDPFKEAGQACAHSASIAMQGVDPRTCGVMTIVFRRVDDFMGFTIHTTGEAMSVRDLAEALLAALDYQVPSRQ